LLLAAHETGVTQAELHALAYDDHEFDATAPGDFQLPVPAES
jgi:hypothetical protein